jgi:hypothetical protein
MGRHRAHDATALPPEHAPRSRVPRVALAALLALAVAALARAESDPFSGYRIPSHRWQGGSVLFALGGQSSAYSDQAPFQDDFWNGASNARWQQGWDSDALQWSIGAALTGNLLSGSREQSFPYWPMTAEQYRHTTSGGWTLVTGMRSYPFPAVVGLDLSGGLTGQYDHAWAVSDAAADYAYSPDHVESHDVTDSRNESLQGAISIAVGVGRVRDATPVQSVHVLEQRLLAAGALARPLSAAARERLAALLTVTPQIRVVHERPGRFEWDEIERVLREDGALGPEGLDAYATMFGAEDDLVMVPERSTGWFAGPALVMDHRRSVQHWNVESTTSSYDGGVFLGSSTATASAHGDEDRDEIWFGGSAEAHRPLGWRWQLDGLGRALAPMRTGEEGLAGLALAQATWFVSDRWEAALEFQYSRTYLSPQGSDGVLTRDDWSSSWVTSLQYRLEDHLALVASIAEYQSFDRLAPAGLAPYRRGTGFSLGVTYDVFRRLDAPGLMDPALPVR